MVLTKHCLPAYGVMVKQPKHLPRCLCYGSGQHFGFLEKLHENYSN